MQIKCTFREKGGGVVKASQMIESKERSDPTLVFLYNKYTKKIQEGKESMCDQVGSGECKCAHALTNSASLSVIRAVVAGWNVYSNVVFLVTPPRHRTAAMRWTRLVHGTRPPSQLPRKLPMIN